MNHKKIGGFLITVCIPLLCIVILLIGLKWRTAYAKTEIMTSSSSDGRYSLYVYMIGEPDWPFGATHCRFELFDHDKKLIKSEVSIRDDGAMAHEDNFDITWDIDHVTVIVSGSEPMSVS